MARVDECTALVSQARGAMAQVESGVGPVDHVTRQNAALVQQSATAAAQLRQQADALAEAVAVFRLEATA